MTNSLKQSIELALRPSRVPGAPQDYELYLNDREQWIVSRAGKIRELQEKVTQRVIVANLTLERLSAIRLRHLTGLRSFEQCNDLVKLGSALPLLRRFMNVRNLHKPPFWAALSTTSKRYNFSVVTSEFNQLQKVCRGTTTEIDAIVEGEKPARLICRQLEPSDIQLVYLWQASRFNEQSTDRNLRRERFSLLSLGYARLAEKLVLRYCKAQGLNPRDVSLSQLCADQNLWKVCDIQTDRYIDVKNATTLGSRTRHVFVPKFKKAGEDDVLIAGVISHPFGEFIENPRRKRKFMGGRFVQNVHQTFLGFAGLRNLSNIQSTINNLPERRQELAMSFYENTLPTWAFEASDGFDLDRIYNAAKLFAHEPASIISLSFATGKKIPNFALAGMSSNQKDVFDQFSNAVNKAGYSKATIAMFSISQFLSWTIDGRNTVGLIRFLRKLNSVEDFGNGNEKDWGFSPPSRLGEKYEVEIEYSGSSCGGLYDPMGSVGNIFNLLERCAIQIRRLSLIFIHFDTPNPHILVGKAPDGRAITIYAYCGGKLESGAWCNQNPLIIGESENCQTCQRLVCQECGFCNEHCQSFKARKADREATDRPKAYRP